MKTRFDCAGVWYGANGKVFQVSEMTTSHLVNCIKFLAQRPGQVMSMLISDIDSGVFNGTVWSPVNIDDRKLSLSNVTSMSPPELQAYVLGTPLFMSMRNEAEQRGVNVDNLLDNISITAQAVTF